MAFENLFIRTKKMIGNIQLDAVISESHSNTVKLTKNPVELGADVTDHAIIQPKKINISAQVSDTPLGIAALGQIIDTVTGLFGTSTSKNLTRSNSAYNALVLLQETREPIEIQTKLKLYENMIITSISTVQDKDSSRIVFLSIDAEEVIIVETEIVEIPSEDLEEGTPEEQASPTNTKGKVEPTTPTPTKQKSVLKTIADWLF